MPSPFRLSWQFNPQDPSRNMSLIFPLYMYKPPQSCLSCFLSKPFHLWWPSDVLIPDLVHSCLVHNYEHEGGVFVLPFSSVSNLLHTQKSTSSLLITVAVASSQVLLMTCLWSLNHLTVCSQTYLKAPKICKHISFLTYPDFLWYVIVPETHQLCTLSCTCLGKMRYRSLDFWEKTFQDLMISQRVLRNAMIESDVNEKVFHQHPECTINSVIRRILVSKIIHPYTPLTQFIYLQQEGNVTSSITNTPHMNTITRLRF